MGGGEIVSVLFTDLVGSTQLSDRLGDDAAERIRQTHFGLLREAVRTRRGQEVKNLGDGLMVVFPSALDALDCAVAMQRRVRRHNREAHDPPLHVRVGVHIGEPIRDEGDYFGTTVNVAKRLCDRAAADEILTSQLVVDLVGSRGGFAFRSLGSLELKGLARPVPAACRSGASSVLGRLMLLVSAIHQDDHDLVAECLDEGRAVLEAASGQMRAMYHAYAGWSDVRLGRLDTARAHAATASSLAERFGDAAMAGALVALLLALVELAAGRPGETAAVVEPVLREPRAAGPTREDAMLTGAWAWVLVSRDQLEEAEAVMAEGVRLAKEIEDGLQLAFCQAWQAGLLRLRHNVVGARAVAESLLDHARQQCNPSFEAAALRELSSLARLDGDLDVADDLAHRALALCASAGLPPDVFAGLVHVAGMAAAEESWEEAARLFGAAEAIRHRLGIALLPSDQTVADADLDLVRRSLGDESFDTAWTEGRALSVEDAVAYAQRGRGQRKRPTTGWASLTPMERQVVELLSNGLRNAEIAERLFIAPSTVKTHLGHVFAKLRVSTRAELAVLAAARKG